LTQLEALTKGVGGERRPHELGQAQDEELEVAEVLDPLQAGDLLAHEPAPVLARPSPGLDLGATEKRLRERMVKITHGDFG
jgi:hypothetical protein